MNDKKFERSIIQNGAATLAGMKVANLFNHSFESAESCHKAISEANEELNGKDVYIELLRHSGDFYLIYIYRRGMLSEALMDEEAGKLLERYGYRHTIGPDRAIYTLKRRIGLSNAFPHEIGVFLGYPVEDIKGFIKNRGRNCICCGLWKVYCNPEEARKYFCRIDKCNSVYMDVYQKGRSLIEMTVSA